MNYSKFYLKSLPEERKKKEIDSIVKEHIADLTNLAGLGKTTFWIPLTHMIDSGLIVKVRNHGNVPMQILITELVTAFEQRFPDCKISYQENWSDHIESERYLRKGILIDWT